MDAAETGLPSRGVQSSATLMGQICSACVRLIPVTGAAVSVTTPDGFRETVYATDDAVAAIEDLHFALGEGPGVAALRERQPVLVGDLGNGAGDRWPLFAPAALHVGARAVFAYPLLVGAGQLGVLLMYADHPGRLDLTQRAQAVRIAHAASFAVLDLLSGLTERAGADGLEIDRDFHRSGVYQASGMVMVQLGVSIEEALIRLRAHAFAHDVPLGEVARQIVERALRLDADPEGGQ